MIPAYQDRPAMPPHLQFPLPKLIRAAAEIKREKAREKSLKLPKSGSRITAAELEILCHIWAEKSNPQIAVLRRTAYQTIKNQIHVLMAKLDIYTRVGLALWYERAIVQKQNGTHS